MYISLHVKYPLFLSDFNLKNFNFLSRFLKNTHIPNFMKSVWWEPSCSMQMYRQTRQS